MDRHLLKGLLACAALIAAWVVFASPALALNDDLTGQGYHAIWAKAGEPNPGLVTVGWDHDTPPDGKAETTTVWNQGYFNG